MVRDIIRNNRKVLISSDLSDKELLRLLVKKLLVKGRVRRKKWKPKKNQGKFISTGPSVAIRASNQVEYLQKEIAKLTKEIEKQKIKITKLKTRQK
jgi:hypothetical protein